MSQDDAELLLIRLRFAVIKTRSNLMELIDNPGKEMGSLLLTRDLVDQLHPWAMSQENIILTTINKILENYKETKILNPIDLLNVLIMVEILEPAVGIVASYLGNQIPDITQGVPEWIGGWNEPRQTTT